MWAVILAGGMGTRLRSITQDRIPKAMAEVQGKPFIYWQLLYLKKQGIKKIILAVHYHASQIQSFVGPYFEGMEIRYSIEKEPLGTGGAVRRAMDHIDGSLAWVLNGDTWFPINLKAMFTHHQQSGNQITIALKKLYDFNRYGSVTVNKNNRITAFKEKNQISAGYINGGIYLLAAEVLKSFKMGERFSMEHDLFEQKVKEVVIGGYKSKARFIDIGMPSDYHQIQTFKLP